MINKKGDNQLVIAIGVFIAILLVGIVIKLSLPNTSEEELKVAATTAEISSTVLEKQTERQIREAAPSMEADYDILALEESAETVIESSGRVSSEYILPFSDAQYYLEQELEQLTREELRLARNEIYARKGRTFNDQQLQSYFNRCSWYQGTIEPDKFKEQWLNVYELANRDLIVLYEQKMGYD